jgi:hypothetical protein
MSLTALVLVAGGGTGWAEAQDGAARDDAGFRYAAKVLCTTGFPDGPEAAEPFAAAGIYATAVNVLNPTAMAAGFEYRVSAPGAPLSRPVTAELGPDETLAIDCRGLPTLFCPVDNMCFDFAFLDGFLIIASPVELDVVVVYSARDSDGQVRTLDVETVHPRSIE